MPYAATMLVFGMLVSSVFWTDLTGRLTVAVGAVLVVLLVIARQLFALYENQRLVGALDVGMSELRAQERRFRSLVQHSSDIIAIVRRDGTLSYVSPGAQPLLGLSPEQIIARPLQEVVFHQDLATVLGCFQRVLTTPELVCTVEARLTRVDGTRRWAEVTLTNLLDDPCVAGVVGNLRDITQAREFHQLLRKQASHDALTGLTNRRYFTDVLAASLARPELDEVSVILIDLNDFKLVNDDFGHAVGDRLLKVTAERLRRAARDGDTVGRLGGDEFAVLLPSAGQRASSAVAAQIITEFRIPVVLDEGSLVLAASLGAATGEPGISPDELLRRADVAMYAAKADRGAGNLRHARYTTALDADFTRLGTWEADLRRAIEHDELQVAYQPIVTLPDARLDGVEALLRWTHVQYGPISPEQFIPVAERTGLIIELGRWIMRTACREAAGWPRGDAERAPTISVNVSARQLREPQFVREVRQILSEVDLPPERLIIELTESIALQHQAEWDTLLELRRHGVQISLDDFGTGQSSLAVLERCPVDQLKLDQRFTWSLAVSGRFAVATAVINTAAALGIEAVAEGVETSEQARCLVERGYRKAQGYYFSRPVGSAEIQNMICAQAAIGSGVGERGGFGGRFPAAAG